MQILLNAENTQSILITKSLLFSFVGSSTLQLVSCERTAEIIRSKVERSAWTMEIKSRWGKKKEICFPQFHLSSYKSTGSLWNAAAKKLLPFISSRRSAVRFPGMSALSLSALILRVFYHIFFLHRHRHHRTKMWCVHTGNVLFRFIFLRSTKCFTFAWKIPNKWTNFSVRNVVLFFVSVILAPSSRAHFRISSCSSICTQLKQQRHKKYRIYSWCLIALNLAWLIRLTKIIWCTVLLCLGTQPSNREL